MISNIVVDQPVGNDVSFDKQTKPAPKKPAVDKKLNQSPMQRALNRKRRAKLTTLW